MIAALPMYDRPETAAAHDALWSRIRAALDGPALPVALTRDLSPIETWRHPRLILGQICGMPYRTEFHGRTVLVGTPDYGLPDTPPGHYRSVFAVRRDDPRVDLAAFAGATLASNGRDSHSGWAVPQLEAARRGFRFGPALFTGAHALSARAVAEGRADIAAIDAVTWRDVERYDPWAAGLRVLERSEVSPGLAFIAAPGADAPRLFDAIAAGIAALAAEHRETLGICGLARIPAADYLAVASPPALQA